MIKANCLIATGACADFGVLSLGFHSCLTNIDLAEYERNRTMHALDTDKEREPPKSPVSRPISLTVNFIGLIVIRLLDYCLNYRKPKYPFLCPSFTEYRISRPSVEKVSAVSTPRTRNI